MTPEEIAAAAAVTEAARLAALKPPSTDTKAYTQAELDALIEAASNEKLKGIKGNLDSAYAQRDAALVEKATAEAERKVLHLAQLEADGKHKEALELRLADEKAKREVLERANTELTRDAAVREALAAHTFRNEKAAATAYKEIVSGLTRTEAGIWVGADGVSIRDTVTKLAADEDYSFLFKAKENNGMGGTDVNGQQQAAKPKSLFAMTQADVIAMAEKGEFRKR